MNAEVRTYIDKDTFIVQLSDGKMRLGNPMWFESRRPEDLVYSGETCAQFVCNRVFEIVNAANDFCKQWPQGPQVEAAQPDPRVDELLQKVKQLKEALKLYCDAWKSDENKWWRSMQEASKNANKTLKERE